MLDDSLISMLYTRVIKIKHLILFENQIQTTSASSCRTQVQPAARFLVCSLIFIEYKHCPPRNIDLFRYKKDGKSFHPFSISIIYFKPNPVHIFCK